MHSIDPKTNTERENYRFLTGSIIPRPIAFVTSMSSNNILNAAPFSYFNIVSSNPPMISVSVQRVNGKQKDTARNISEKGEFVVHIVDTDNVRQINKTAASLQPEENEIALTELTEVASTKVSVPGIKQAKIRLECTLEHILEIGDETNPGADLIIGKVVHYHVDQLIYDQGKIDPKKLSAVSRLAGANYAKIGELFSIERPK